MDQRRQGRQSVQTTLYTLHTVTESVIVIQSPYPQVTYADFAICVLLQVITTKQPSLLETFPALEKLKASVEQLPRIKEWMSKRPETPY